MTRADKLEILELLSALESWGFSTKSEFPNFLHERIGSVMAKLRDEILQHDYKSAIISCLNNNGHLADGDDCTLIDLKRAVSEWEYR